MHYNTLFQDRNLEKKNFGEGHSPSPEKPLPTPSAPTAPRLSCLGGARFYASRIFSADVDNPNCDYCRPG